MGMEIVNLLGERGGEKRERIRKRIWSKKIMDNVGVLREEKEWREGRKKDGNSRLGIEGMDWGLRI